MNVDSKDKALADAFEAAYKEAATTGITGYAEPIMTAEQYEPAEAPAPGVAVTVARDSNRVMGVAVAQALKVQPFRLPVFRVHGAPTLPAASDWLGCLVFVPDASGSPIVAFSDGTNWKRCDTNATVT